MAELELEGLHPDGEHLILLGSDGQRYRLVIDDALRAAVRRDRAQFEQVRTAGSMRPRDIQVRLRAGSSVEEVAAEAGLPVEHVRRYEGPVMAERAWVAEQARLIAIGHESDAPRLGDLVIDRLAARGVSPRELQWIAIRRPGEQWEVSLSFRAGDRDRQARWSVDLQTRSVRALDDEGRWLSEVELGASATQRHLSTVRSLLFDAEDAALPLTDSGDAQDAADEDESEEQADGDQSDDEPPSDGPVGSDPTGALLDELSASRGIRHEVTTADMTRDEDDWSDPPPAHPPASAPHERPDAAILALPLVATSPDADEAEEARPAADSARKRQKSRRQSIPSWDEIVFGAKTD